jgi:hypothetical protein
MVTRNTSFSESTRPYRRQRQYWSPAETYLDLYSASRPSTSLRWSRRRRLRKPHGRNRTTLKQKKARDFIQLPALKTGEVFSRPIFRRSNDRQNITFFRPYVPCDTPVAALIALPPRPPRGSRASPISGSPASGCPRSAGRSGPAPYRRGLPSGTSQSHRGSVVPADVNSMRVAHRTFGSIVHPRRTPLVRLLVPGVSIDGQRQLQQVDHLVGQALFAWVLFPQHDVELARGSDLFEDFQFPQPHEDRIVRQ